MESGRKEACAICYLRLQIHEKPRRYRTLTLEREPPVAECVTRVAHLSAAGTLHYPAVADVKTR